MHKEELLQMLSAAIQSGEIRREEVINRLSLAPQTPAEAESARISPHFSVTKMLYVLGIAIIVIGIVFFVAQIWEDIGSFSRILVTLGLGLCITAIGSVLLMQRHEENIGPVFHAIGGMLIPGGAVVTLYELGDDFTSLWPIAITFGAIFVFYLILNTAHKHAVLTFFAIANGTAFLYLLVGAMLGDSYYYDPYNLYAYLTMIVGASYILLAHASRDTWNKPLVRVLYFFGITGLLGAAFSQVFDSAMWELLYFPLVICGLFLSVHLRSRSVLVMSTLFLIAHLSYITSEYFADSIGWPISLVILGFIFIGLGYTSITINKKYLQQA